MKRNPHALSQKEFDLAVIGGGIHGAAVAREAALRGLKVAVVEASDFASGTSSRSSKLIHGGLRYLEQYEFRLVREARIERRLMVRLAPHLARPVPFLLPIYQGDPYSPGKIRLGLTLYDWMGNLGRKDRHRMLPRERALNLVPALRPDGLRAGAVYHDSLTDDARLTIENIVDAAEHGAIVVNYAALRGFAAHANGKAPQITAGEVEDRLTGRRYQLEARFWVNATGPWVDRVRALMPGYDGSRTVRLTKGTHLIIPAVTGPVALLAAIPPGDRVFLIVPWHHHALLGTTDTDYEADPASVAADAADTEYLLAAANRLLTRPLTPADVRGSWSGVRALAIEPERKPTGPSANSREYRFHSDAWAGNLISICGGKLTTSRALAEKLVGLVTRRLDGSWRETSSRSMPLPGGHTGVFGVFLNYAAWEGVRQYNLPYETAERIVLTYGSRWRRVLEPLRDHPELADRLPGSPALLAAEVRFAIEEEMAIHAEDFLLRRSGLNWCASLLPEAAPAVEGIFKAARPAAPG